MQQLVGGVPGIDAFRASCAEQLASASGWTCEDPCPGDLPCLDAAVADGVVRGRVRDVHGVAANGAAAAKVAEFKGIPFAAPPVGANRWRPPQPVEPWGGDGGPGRVLDAGSFKHNTWACAPAAACP